MTNSNDNTEITSNLSLTSETIHTIQPTVSTSEISNLTSAPENTSIKENVTAKSGNESPNCQSNRRINEQHSEHHTTETCNSSSPGTSINVVSEHHETAANTSASPPKKFEKVVVKPCLEPIIGKSAVNAVCSTEVRDPQRCESNVGLNQNNVLESASDSSQNVNDIIGNWGPYLTIISQDTSISSLFLNNIPRRYHSEFIRRETNDNVSRSQERTESTNRCTETENSNSITITPLPFSPCVPQGPPPLAGAPPSYSAVMQIGPINSHTSRNRGPIRIQPSPPFIAPVPPPTYSQAQGYQIERPVIIASVFPTFSVDQMVWGPNPISVICPSCAHVVVTTTQTQRSNLTHVAALTLFFCGCWPCCLFPYCMDTCKNTYHSCPNCQQLLGIYRPW